MIKVGWDLLTETDVTLCLWLSQSLFIHIYIYIKWKSSTPCRQQEARKKKEEKKKKKKKTDRQKYIASYRKNGIPMGEHKCIEDHRQSMEKISTKNVMIKYQHKADVLELFCAMESLEILVKLTEPFAEKYI